MCRHHRVGPCYAALTQPHWKYYQPPCCEAWLGSDLDHQIKLAYKHTFRYAI